MPTFQWHAVNGANVYRIQVDNNPGFDSMEINDGHVYSTSYTPSSALAPGTYYWRVQAGVIGDGSRSSPFSDAWQVTITSEGGALPKPTLRSPANDSSLENTTPQFQWNDVPGANVYRIQVDSDLGFGSKVINNGHVYGTSYTPSSPLSPGTYYWRIQAGVIGDSSRNSPFSDAWKVTITGGGGALPKPTLKSPANGASLENTTPQFQWNDVLGANVYHIQVDSNLGFGSKVIDDGQVDATFYTPGSPLSPGTYYWRIQAGNAADVSPWSDVWAITIESGAAWTGIRYLPLVLRDWCAAESDDWWESEPNDDPGSADGPLLSGETYFGEQPQRCNGMSDYFYYDSPTRHDVHTWLSNLAVECDYDLYLYDVDGTPRGSSRGWHNEDEHLSLPGLSTGRYYIEVRCWRGCRGSQPYHLQVVYD